MTPNATRDRDAAAREKAEAVRMAEANAPRPRLGDAERPPSVFLKGEQPSREPYQQRAWVVGADGSRRLDVVPVWPAASLRVIHEDRLTRSAYCAVPGTDREVQVTNNAAVRYAYEDLRLDECLIERPEYDPEAKAGSVLGLSYIVAKWVEPGTGASRKARAERRANPQPRPAVTMAGNLSALVARYRLTLSPSGGLLVKTTRTLRPDEAATLTVLEPLLAAHLAGRPMTCDLCEAEAVGVALVNVALCAEHAAGAGA